MKVKITFTVLSLFLLTVFTGGCERAPSVDDVQQAKTERVMGEASAQVGMPNIVNWQELKMMKAIYELRDKSNITCYAYIKSDYSGTLTYIGKCLGYGLPASVQFSNPEKVVWPGGGHQEKLPQAEPNGLFMPDGLAATWLMLIDPKTNKPHAVYIEQEIVVSPFPLHE